jgi:hypothetical protein
MNWTPCFSNCAIKVIASPSQNDKLYIFVSAIDHFYAQTLKKQAGPHVLTIFICLSTYSSKQKASLQNYTSSTNGRIS